ncbi:MAG TPA: ATP-dependent Clp protease adaptor ClpS [Lentimicrobium sp.]|nr:ATP-dependent Clp protease adaptor ClpS [Lentimicrobium sp.]
MNKEKTSPEFFAEELLSDVYELILFNDEVNDFDFVIDSLIEVCKLDPIQAEQITLIVHEKGKCGVVSGTLDELRPMYESLSNKGLSVSID